MPAAEPIREYRVTVTTSIIMNVYEHTVYDEDGWVRKEFPDSVLRELTADYLAGWLSPESIERLMIEDKTYAIG